MKNHSLLTFKIICDIIYQQTKLRPMRSFLIELLFRDWNKMKNKNTFGIIMLLITSIIWGIAFVFQRTGMDHIEPVTFNAVRMSAGAIFIATVCIIRDFKAKNNKSATANKKSCVKSTLIGGIGCGLFLTAASLIQQVGLVYTTAGKAGFITAMYMLFVPILNLSVLKVNGSAKTWISVVIGMVGMYLLCVKEELVLGLGDALIFLCAILFAGHILWCDRFAPKSDAIKMSAIQFLVASFLSWIIAFIFESPSVDKIISATIPILYCGIVSGGIGYTLQIVGQKYVAPAHASLIMSLESVFAVIAGVLFINESMTLQEVFGCIILFAAIILVQLPSKTKQRT
jgi:drug/metabolite transporter (DMT)-like permease